MPHGSVYNPPNTSGGPSFGGIRSRPRREDDAPALPGTPGVPGAEPGDVPTPIPTDGAPTPVPVPDPVPDTGLPGDTSTPTPAAGPAAPAPAAPVTYAPGETYQLEDASVQSQLQGILSQDSALLQQGRTRGLQAANRRGLQNSTMGVQAGEGGILSAALPIASQDAAQANARNLTAMGIAGQQSIAGQNTAAFNREKATAAIAAFDKSYGDAFRTIAQNENLPAAVRDEYLSHLGLVKDSNFDLIQQIYDIDLTWASTVAAPAAA